MSERREFYAATLEEAADKASATLGIARDRLEFEVLDRGSTGFLGIGARDARILVEHAEPQTGDPVTDEGSQPAERPKEVSSLPDEELSEVVEHEREPTAVPAAESSDDLILAIDEFMTALTDAMGFDATVDAYEAGDVITVDVTLEETGLFIGQKGETIDAVQYLLNVAVYKDRPFLKRIVVDAEGYRQRRVEAIQGMANRTARRALREKRSLSLPPMPPAERRVVHIFLKDNPNVTTSSDGEEEARRVIVSPI